MAKTSSVNKNKRRAQLVKRLAAKRARRQGHIVGRAMQRRRRVRAVGDREPEPNGVPQPGFDRDQRATWHEQSRRL